MSGYPPEWVLVDELAKSPRPGYPERQGIGTDEVDDWIDEIRGIPKSNLGGTIQNDILKEYIAQKEYIFPPNPSMRLVTDTVEYGTKYMPKWNTISISGYHIREAGSTAVQELAFTLADGYAYADWAIERGLNIDEFAPRFSFFFNSHNDFFDG